VLLGDTSRLRKETCALRIFSTIFFSGPLPQDD